jgi:hypothetical protein
MKSLAVMCVVVLSALTPGAAWAQAAKARLVVTVVDTSGAVIPDASVTMLGIDDTTKAAAVAPVKTTEKGIATFDNLVPGRYSIEGSFPGFELGLLRDVRLRSGDNKHLVVLPIKKMETEVTVGRDAQAVAADPRARFGTALTREQIEALSDDPRSCGSTALRGAGCRRSRRSRRFTSPVMRLRPRTTLPAACSSTSSPSRGWDLCAPALTSGCATAR